MRLTTLLVGCTGIVVAGAATYVGLVTGRLTLDLGMGRRTRPLGPIVVEIAAPREVVYGTATAPYAERGSRAMAEKVRILERTETMVLATHYTPVGTKLTAATVETVSFDPPQLISFRLLRGPVPLVTETFELVSIDTGTRLTYTGELGTDLAWVGERWGDLVTHGWINAVQSSLDAIKTESERRSLRPCTL